MPQEDCILTTKDFTILEVMRERCIDGSDPMRTLLDRKLGRARVVFREDAPATLATLSSRVTYTINGDKDDTRILSHDRMNAPTGLFLPITTVRGLALLGLCEGQSLAYTARDGRAEIVRLESVQFQPEAARREMEAAARLATPEQRRAIFRIVGGSGAPQAPAPHESPDDPGPSAA